VIYDDKIMLVFILSAHSGLLLCFSHILTQALQLGLK